MFWNNLNRKRRLRWTAKAIEKISFEAEENEPRTMALIPCEELDGISFYLIDFYLHQYSIYTKRNKNIMSEGI